MKFGTWLFGIASAVAGILDLVWREFEPAHQPLQAWSDHIPAVTVLACFVGTWLIAAGIALLVPRTMATAAAASAVLYGIFCFFPLPRLVSAPKYLGHHPGVYIGVLVSIGQQFILFLAAFVLWWTLTRATPLPSAVAALLRWIFGLCAIDFGLGHFTALQPTAAMVPGWMPIGGSFWAIVTGVAFILAGLGIISGVLDVLAARLLGLMLLVFSIVVLTPRVFSAPHAHMAWGGDAYNLTAAGATWIFAAWLAALKCPIHINDQVQTDSSAPA